MLSKQEQLRDVFLVLHSRQRGERRNGRGLTHTEPTNTSSLRARCELLGTERSQDPGRTGMEVQWQQTHRWFLWSTTRRESPSTVSQSHSGPSTLNTPGLQSQESKVWKESNKHKIRTHSTPNSGQFHGKQHIFIAVFSHLIFKYLLSSLKKRLFQMTSPLNPKESTSANHLSYLT